MPLSTLPPELGTISAQKRNWFTDEKLGSIKMKNCTELLSKEIISLSNNKGVSFDSDEDIFCLDPSTAQINGFLDGITS